MTIEHMIPYSLALLSDLGAFLVQPPVIYLVVLFLLLFIAGLVRRMIS